MARLGLCASVFVTVAAANATATPKGAGANAPVAIVLATGKAPITNRALDAWYAARDRDTLPAITPHVGFPKIIDDPRVDAPPGEELLLLGACDRAAARRVVAALAAVHAEATTLQLELPGLRGTCPRLTATPRSSVAAVLAAKDPRGAKRRARRRNEIAECGHEPAELRRTFGDGYLCRSLWGVDCATYAEQVATVVPRGGGSCPFLLDNPAARSLLALRTPDLHLTICAADLPGDLSGGSDDGAVAYVFTRLGDTGVDYPATAICGQGSDFGTRLGDLHPFGDGACIEYRRTFKNAAGMKPIADETGLHCYIRIDRPPFAAFDRVTVNKATTHVPGHTAGRYGIVNVGRESILCLEQRDTDLIERWALRLGPRGFRPVEPPPSQCARATYREIAPAP